MRRQLPQAHSQRVVRRFLLLPMILPYRIELTDQVKLYERRWLEWADILQRYDFGGFLPSCECWHSVAWNDDPPKRQS